MREAMWPQFVVWSLIIVAGLAFFITVGLGGR